MNDSRLLIACILLLLAAAPAARAWGPHPEITRAAQTVLPERDRAAAYFGPDWPKFADYCWMGDWRGSVRPDFYPDDFLLFPEAPRHYDHLVPDVRHTYEPFFRRSLQALRTESPTNAARWIGSLLHFVEDTGSPPHAAEIRGELHTRMENWLDGKAITIAGYSPQLLGTDDASALAGFQRRMDGLITFSKTRAEQMRSYVESLKSREDLPLSLECADETARVCADLLHTLLTLGMTAPAQPALAGRVTWPADAPMPAHPAKLILLGTSYSTLTAADGSWSFRNLPAADHEIAVQRVGATTIITHDPTVTLPPSDPPGNLVRNADFKLHWINPRQPDHWSPIVASQKMHGWESANISVRLLAAYRIGCADPQPGTRLGVRWRNHPVITEGATTAVWTPGETDHQLTAPAGATYAQVLVLTDQPLSKSVSRVWFVAAPHP